MALGRAQVTRLTAALLAAHTLAGAAYECEGDHCCDHVCTGAKCRTTPAGASVPTSWPSDSCTELVASNYDATTLCSQALAAFEPCALDQPHACGYGLACIAESITSAICVPVCAPAFSDELLHVDSAAAGCVRDGQYGSAYIDDTGARTPVGRVRVSSHGIAVPGCLPEQELANVSGSRLARLKARHHREAPAAALPPGEQGRRTELALQAVGLNLLFHEVRCR